MSRRLALGLALVSLLLAALGAWPASGPSAGAASSPATTSSAPRAEATRPNIVFILTDDQAATDMRWMPRTRRLIGRQGATFTNLVASNPLCCPARATLLTGQYSHNNGVRDNSGPYGGYAHLDTSSTFATWLQGKGYRTAIIGKYLNGYEKYARENPDVMGHEPGWDVSDLIIQNLYRYYDFVSTGNGEPAAHYDIHNSDWVTQRSVDLIDEFAAEQSPFLVYANYTAPHGYCGTDSTAEFHCVDAALPATRHRDLHLDAVPPDFSRASFNERDVSDKPSLIRHRKDVGRRAMRQAFVTRIQALASVDEGVARIVQELADQGQLDNTYLIFSSDNGYLLGEHRWSGKVVPYTEALRVPLLIRGPGIPAGVVRRQPVTSVDIAPTIGALAGARVPADVDGASLVPVLTRNAPRKHAVRVIQTSRNNAPWMYRGILADRYSYVRWRRGFVELYDLQRDPYEIRNVAHDPRYARVLTAMKQRMKTVRSCAGATCRRSFTRVPNPTR